ncbi:MAG: DUF3877 family protein [Clostridia bacterium]|nr:DUF3877 family protein [Clostridia bacterium]
MVSQELYNNILDNIKEAHLKLGYSESAISLNYQKRSLCHLIGDSDMKVALEELKVFASPMLGELTFRFKENQVRVTVPAEGVKYVAENVPEKPHLRDLIELIKKPLVTMDQIKDVFNKYSDQVMCKATDESGMDFVIWFGDGQPDDYRYCICLDGLGATYHRLSKKDFQDIYNI